MAGGGAPDYKKMPEDITGAITLFRDQPFLAFLPRFANAIAALDAYYLDSFSHLKKYRGLSESALRKTPEFLATQRRSTGVPRHLTAHQRAVVYSLAVDRFMVGSNRIGKTFVSALEIAWWAFGEHPNPARELPPRPAHIWACCPDFHNVGKDINLPMLRWVLGKAGKWKEADKTFVSVNVWSDEEQSRIRIKGYDSGPEKFGGADIDLYGVDEPPPQPIYDELVMRIGEYTTNSLWTLTPVGTNAPWIYTRIYRPWDDAGRPPEKFFMENVDIKENEHLDPMEVEKRERELANDPDQAKIRLRGEWGHIGGLLYGGPMGLHADVHYVPDFEIPGVHRAAGEKEAPWCLYRAVDPGIRNEAAVAWIAVSPEGLAWLYRCYLMADRSIPEICGDVKSLQTVHERDRGFRLSVVGTEGGQRDHSSAKTRISHYAENGLVLVQVPNRPVDEHVSKLKEAISWGKDEAGHWRREPRLRIFRSCTDAWRQMRNAAWRPQGSRSGEDPKEVTLKKDDHLENAVRYLFAYAGGPRFFMPTDEELVRGFDDAEWEPDPKTGW